MGNELCFRIFNRPPDGVADVSALLLLLLLDASNAYIISNIELSHIMNHHNIYVGILSIDNVKEDGV